MYHFILKIEIGILIIDIFCARHTMWGYIYKSSSFHRWEDFFEIYFWKCVHTGIRNQHFATHCQMLPVSISQYSIDQYFQSKRKVGSCTHTHTHKNTRVVKMCFTSFASCNSVHWVSQSILSIKYIFIVIAVHLEFDNRFIGWTWYWQFYIYPCV